MRLSRLSVRARAALGIGLALVVVLAILVWPRSAEEVGGVAVTPEASGVRPPAGSADVGEAGIGDEYYPTAGNGGYDVSGYDVELRYRPDTDRLDGVTTITATATQRLTRFNVDLALEPGTVTVDGRPAQVRKDGLEVQITPARPVEADASMTVRVEYSGVPSQVRLDQSLLGQSSPWVRTDDGAVVIGQPENAAWWYPANDHPSDKASIGVTITVPSGVEAISNGALVAGPEPAGDGLDRWTWRAEQPMAPYLAFVAIGQYEVVRRDTAAGPYLAAYAEGLSPDVAADARASVERTPQVVEFLADIFGPYPFDVLGGVVPDAPDLAFALETQTRPVYGPVFFATGEDPSVVVHELAHQWYGDSVSLRRWQDIWLNEGFATYAEWLFEERNGGLPAARTANDEYRDIPREANFWQLPPGDPGAPNLLSGPIYLRGAMTLQAIRTAVGDEDFFAILRTWATERAGENAVTEDFVAVAERVSGQQLDELIDTWLFASGRPDAPPG